ncbi:MAG TPA: type VI secretion system tip protein VgrG [Syntrophorhabdales bacterium]|nr:type VI secretion system tip protein VgrG [Syntrophorhabdales bacterium]
MAYTQENRIISIDTPLGAGVLLLTGLSGIEGISMPFRFELELVSENHTIAFEKIVGQNVTVSIQLPKGDNRFINGIISEFLQAGGGIEDDKGRHFAAYGAILVPELWMLDVTTDSRIFQNLTAPQIVENILTENNISYKTDLRGQYQTREYCVQYRETDFNFVSRLMEEEGICYYFQHEAQKHTMFLADRTECHKECPNQQTARYQLSADGTTEDDVITGLDWKKQIRYGRYTVKDFNFTTPKVDLEASVSTRYRLGPGEREAYYYPAGHTTKAEGERIARLRMEEEETKITMMSGSSTCRAFTSGYRFRLEDYYRGDMDQKEYVLTSVEHEASQPIKNESPFDYSNTFVCIPYEVQYRPKRSTRKPLVMGSQTAMVVGPPGEEIYTDEYGRIKVQFHWDRLGKKDDKSSCWIRVSQVWAGPGWGAVIIPRIGHEVVVDFLEGDPDRPLVTGSVYNAINKPPYPLPDEKTKSTLKSDSSKGGGGFNEIRFEDKKGSEEIFVHGQKDYNIVVENNTTHTTVKTHTIKAEEILVEGTKKVTIKAASSSIEIDAGGITIKGSPLVKINP